MRDDDERLQPALLLRALSDRLPVVLAPKETLLRPRCSEQRELLLRHVCSPVTHVVLLLLADDGVRETVGESDGGDVMIRRGAIAEILLRTTLSVAIQGGDGEQLTSLTEVDVLGVGLAERAKSALEAPKNDPNPRTLARLNAADELLMVEVVLLRLADRLMAPPLQVP